MTTPTPHGATELLPCPFCGQFHTLKITAASELFADEDEEVPYMHSESYAVICDASGPGGPGGCGGQGGFKPTEAEAIAVWNTRAAIQQAQQRDEPLSMSMFASRADFEAAKKAAGAVPEGALIERIATHWDGCIYDCHVVGEVDIGAAIRQNAKHFAASPAIEPAKQQPDSVHSPLTSEQVLAVIDSVSTYSGSYEMAIVRATEKALGIHSAGGECGGVRVPLTYTQRRHLLESLDGSVAMGWISEDEADELKAALIPATRPSAPSTDGGEA